MLSEVFFYLASFIGWFGCEVILVSVLDIPNICLKKKTMKNYWHHWYFLFIFAILGSKLLSITIFLCKDSLLELWSDVCSLVSIENIWNRGNIPILPGPVLSNLWTLRKLRSIPPPDRDYSRFICTETPEIVYYQ